MAAVFGGGAEAGLRRSAYLLLREKHQTTFAPSAREASVLFRLSRVNREAIYIEGGAKLMSIGIGCCSCICRRLEHKDSGLPIYVQLIMNKYREIQLLAMVFWAGSIWVAYWSGYGQGLFEGNHGVYALASSGVIQDVHTLVRLNGGGGIDEARTELVGSIKFKLQGMELREQAEDA